MREMERERCTHLIDSRTGSSPVFIRNKERPLGFCTRDAEVLGTRAPARPSASCSLRRRATPACERQGGGRYREVLPPSFAAAPNKVTRFSMDTHTHTAQKTQKPSAAFPGHAAKRSVFCVKEDSTGVCCYTRPPGAICMKGRGGGGTTCARRSLQRRREGGRRT